MKYENPHETFMKVLDSRAPRKQKLVRGNHQPFMNKTLCSADVYIV